MSRISSEKKIQFPKRDKGKEERLVKCSIFDCQDKAIGRFKPDARVLCIGHGVRYSQDWFAIHGFTGLLGIIVQ
jgi:hypothetical protein